MTLRLELLAPYTKNSDGGRQLEENEASWILEPVPNVKPYHEIDDPGTASTYGTEDLSEESMRGYSL